jgi:hypothetical protein
MNVNHPHGSPRQRPFSSTGIIDFPTGASPSRRPQKRPLSSFDIRPTSADYEGSAFSREETPYSGIDDRVVRELRKRFDTGANAKIADVVTRAIQAYTGSDVVDGERVAFIISKIVEDDVFQFWRR